MVKMLSVDGSNAEVKEVMECINAYVSGDSESFVMFQFANAKRDMQNLLEVLNNGYHLNIYPDFSYGGFKSHIKTFIKKVVYRLTSWYFQYIAQQQSEINANMIRCLNRYLLIIEAYHKENLRLKEDKQ